MSEDTKPAARATTCSLPHCDEPAGSGVCNGTTRHGLCDACFCGYASSQFDALGAFTSRRVSSRQIDSAPGELPCYLFLTNECDCASIPSATLARVLSTNQAALKAYESARRRLFQVTQDHQDHTRSEAALRKQELSPVEKLHQVVVDALSRGGYVPCPECGQHGQKNDACMHMQCPCGTRYCYCCGRKRGKEPINCRSNEAGCGYPSPYLENHPGWNEFSLNEGESAGMGALHEFHRRRMIYFLRQVKVNYPAELWEQLRQDYPNLLDGVPTIGRRIEWDEIDTVVLPLFGGTLMDEVTWRCEGVHACDELVAKEQLPANVNLQRHGFSGGWQSDKDVNDRRRMITRIADLLQQQKSNAYFQEWRTKIPQTAKRIEESLYRSARSIYEYNAYDVITLKEHIIEQIQDRGLNGGWQSDKHINERRRVVSRIVHLLHQLKPNAPRELLAKVPLFAKQLELSLYTSANSIDEYKDVSTLMRRVRQVLKICAHLARQQDSRDQNQVESGSPGAMAPANSTL